MHSCHVYSYKLYLHSHQDLMQLYSASTRRSNSITTEKSAIMDKTTSYLSQTDLEILKQKFQFIRDDEDDAEQGQTNWQVRMSVRYYQKLFREYALADLSRYKEGKIGLRWRIETEVITGKGQFICGNKHCDERIGLHSYELLFAYMEHGKKKRCLVKVRACSDCAEKLFHKKLEEMRKKDERKLEKRERKRRQLEKKGVSDENKDKRRKRSASDCVLDSTAANDLYDASEWKQRWGENDTLSAGSERGRIHELCAKINAEQNAAYPRDSKQRVDEFEELLP